MITTLWRLWSSLRRFKRGVLRVGCAWAYCGDDKFWASVPGRSNIALRKMTSQSPQPSGAEFPLDGVVHHQVEGISLKGEGDVVHGEQLGVLADEGVFGFGQNSSQGLPLQGSQSVSTGNLPMSSGIKPNARKSEGSTKASASCSSTT